MRYLLIVSFVFSLNAAAAQDTVMKQGGMAYTLQRVYPPVDVKPKFNGNLNAYLQSNLKIPQMPPGTKIIAEFVIDTAGYLHDVQIKKDKPGEPLTPFEKDLKRAIEKMPPWIPGQREGEAVPVKYSLPLHF